MTHPLKFCPPQTFIEPSFWEELYQRKLNVYKLSAENEALNVCYTCSDGQRSEAFLLDRSSFEGNNDDNHDHGSGKVRVQGTLTNVNTVEEFKNFDKKKLLDDCAGEIWRHILTLEAVRDPTLLQRFVLLTFADLKSYRFTYWFATPALLPAEAILFDHPQGMSTRLSTTAEIVSLYRGMVGLIHGMDTSRPNLSIEHEDKDKEMQSRSLLPPLYVLRECEVEGVSVYTVLTLAQAWDELMSTLHSQGNESTSTTTTANSTTARGTTTTSVHGTLIRMTVVVADTGMKISTPVSTASPAPTTLRESPTAAGSINDLSAAGGSGGIGVHVSLGWQMRNVLALLGAHVKAIDGVDSNGGSTGSSDTAAPVRVHIIALRGIAAKRMYACNSGKGQGQHKDQGPQRLLDQYSDEDLVRLDDSVRLCAVLPSKNCYHPESGQGLGGGGSHIGVPPPPPMPRVVGWESNERGKPGPRVADLSAAMDSSRLMEQAVDLNLRLMKVFDAE